MEDKLDENNIQMEPLIWLPSLRSSAGAVNFEEDVEEKRVRGLRCDEVKEATRHDEAITAVRVALTFNKWDRKEVLAPYQKVKRKLSYENGLLSKDGKVVPPESLRAKILEETHAGHPGIVRMKSLLRQTYWWPGINKMAEQKCRECGPCQKSQKSNPVSVMPERRIPKPSQPGQQYAIDITGPYFNGHSVVILVDYNSRFPFYLDTIDTSTRQITKWLDTVFQVQGLPQGLVSDNGPQFTSKEFESYLDERDIFHYTTPVYAPQENGLVERFNRYVKTGVQAFTSAGTEWNKGLDRLMVSYRAAPQEDQSSPAEKFNRRPYRAPWQPNLGRPQRRRHVPRWQLNHGKLFDDTIWTGFSVFKRGEKVMTKLQHVSKGKSPFSEPKEIIQVLGAYTFRLVDGSVWNARNLKKWKEAEEESDDQTYLLHDDPAGQFNQPTSTTAAGASERAGETTPRLLPSGVFQVIL